jgi:hypothetical protein
MENKLKKALKEHMRQLARKGGLTTAKKYGSKHMSEIVKMRWAKAKGVVDKST